MKYTDITKLQEAGLITLDQKQRIIEHYDLKEDGSKFLAIISMIGAVLAGCGIILLIYANWDVIPRGVKIAVGLMLMFAAHAGGYYLREVHQRYRKTGEALHLIGAGLFLANIALIGQIYHLSSRPPNAILLWWGGIAALPWLLRAKSLHILSLLSLSLWFGLEINQRDSVLFFGHDAGQLTLFALLGLVYLGASYPLRQTRYADFAPSMERLGLLGFQVCSFPLTWELFYYPEVLKSPKTAGVFAGFGLVALGLLACGLRREGSLTRQWRCTWFGALAAAVALMAGALWLSPLLTISRGQFDDAHHSAYNWIAAVVLFVIALLQIQVGVQIRSRFYINLGVAAIAGNIGATYINLIGSMTQTGLMFLISGVFLILFGVFLEKKRRGFVRQLQAA